ncbi:MAG: condensation domain-containing protein [Acidobacteriaceae bacterium]
MQNLTATEFLEFLKRRDIDVRVRDGRLRIHAPSGVVDLELRAELARRKPEIIAILQAPNVSQPLAPLVPKSRSGKIPQTHAQQGMWLIDHFDPGHVAYNIPQAFIANVSIDLENFQDAVDGLVARHETLRTSFYEEDGELFQSVSLAAGARVGFTDLSQLAESDRQKELGSLIRDQARLPFDLTQPPLVRFHIFRMAQQQHVIFFNIHHIISDARSLTILGQELSALYRAALLKETPVLSHLSVQFADYAIWVDKQMGGDAMERQIEYWKSKLAGAPQVLDLPISVPYPEQRTAAGATTPVFIPATVRDTLKTIGTEERATLFMTLLAVFAVLLFRQAGKDDLCIGSPVTHRKHVETEPLIGLFVNMVVFRCEMAGSPTFRELLIRVRNTSLEAFENSEVPFQEVVRALKPDPRLRRSPLFQIMFSFEPNQGLEDDNFIQIDANSGTARFDLTLQLRDRADGIAGLFEYSTDLFQEARIAELARQFSALVQQVTENPDIQISAIEVSPPAEPELARHNAPSARKKSFWGSQMKRVSMRFGRATEGK